MARFIWFPAIAVLSLAACSSRPAAQKKQEPPPPPPPPQTTTQPAAAPKPQPPTPAAPAQPETPKAEVPKAEEPKPAEPAPAPAADDKKEEPKNEPAAEPKPEGTDAAPLGKETGFENEFVAGKTVRAWITALDSKDKEVLTEALEVLKNVGKRAGMAEPKLQALTSNPDAEIAASARDALDAVRNKD